MQGANILVTDEGDIKLGKYKIYIGKTIINIAHLHCDDLESK